MSQVDLRQLAVDRSGSAPATVSRRRNYFTRYAVPGLILATFVGVVAWSLRDSLLPAERVTVVPVILARAEVQQSGTPLFQAAGWIEPRPTAVMASAMVEGVVEKLLVVEGQPVEAEQPIAQLIDIDARLALNEVEASVGLREAELNAAESTLAAARRSFEHPVHLEVLLADGEAALAKINTERKNLPFLIRAAEARQLLSQQELERKKKLSDALSGRALQQAQSDFDAATATLEELGQRGPNLEKESEAWQRKCAALASQLELNTSEHKQLAEAEASVKVAEARLKQARLAVDAAKLRVERMTVRAPIAGRVLALHAQPGRRLMGLTAASERDASTVASLYDPQQLQVRADVRLEDVPQVTIGQPVQITTASSATPLAGEVIAVTSQADIQKNTLQVKVAIHDPPAVVRPEMLAQVTFLAPEQPGGKTEGAADPLRLLVPRELIEGGEGGATVWVADPTTRQARQKPVQLGKAGTEQLVEVAQGLTAMDKLIVAGREGLSEGERIQVVGEDHRLGGGKSAGSTSPSPAPLAAAEQKQQK
jgi:RND family efflux transporter MFP subunit